ncbi:CLUMA_CG011218, isoform A [Clunio marinus]|uniref:Cullin-2 n=1 Tax=Clunio marinus TaxID=568069 RepID=A0A1J1IDK7_9DIPT|nr:CLUMA_CG011218, isoform A [Clunio marinus]
MSLKPRRILFDEVWGCLKTTVEKVITLRAVKKDKWNDSFNDVYSICVAYPEPLADRLYTETKLFLENHVKSQLDDFGVYMMEVNDTDNSQNQLLHKYYSAWKNYSEGLGFLNSLYSYLNQQHIKKQKVSEAEILYGNGGHLSVAQEQMEIGELGLDIWRIFMIQNLGDILVKQILQGIERDRVESNLSSKDIETLNGVIHSFVMVQDYKKKGNLKLYENMFEGKMLEASGEYFKSQASKLLQTCSVSQYMQEVIRILDEENIRAHKFMHISSIQKLKKECEDRMITDHKYFLYSECKDMVSNDKRDDLKNLYTLLKPIVDGLKELIQFLLEQIKNEGTESVMNLKGENIHIQFVENMLQVHQKYENLISETFKNDPLFLSALDKACASVINSKLCDGKTACRSAELVAKYHDSLLKKSKSTESEIETKLTKSITIFKYIEDKDVYQKFYSRMLAKRLIHDQSVNMELEEVMINKLKQACGYEFTNKLHRMYTDVGISMDLNNKFNQHLKNQNNELHINLSIKILQAGAWPLGPQTAIPFAVPQEFEKPIRDFETFYNLKFSGRKLSWLHHLCHGELKVSLAKKSYLITMQTYQMAMLLLFENCDTLSCKDIKDVLQLNNNENFQKHLQSLIDSKLLTVDTEKIEESSIVSFNLDFSNKRTKFKITASLQKESPQQEVEQTHTQVDEDRKLYLQAAIVRIMKSRKVLKHNALIQEILSQSKVSFAPSIPMIKKCIESLIDKQYIERTANSSDEYSYVA